MVTPATIIALLRLLEARSQKPSRISSAWLAQKERDSGLLQVRGQNSSNLLCLARRRESGWIGKLDDGRPTPLGLGPREAAGLGRSVAGVDRLRKLLAAGGVTGGGSGERAPEIVGRNQESTKQWAAGRGKGKGQGLSDGEQLSDQEKRWPQFRVLQAVAACMVPTERPPCCYSLSALCFFFPFQPFTPSLPRSLSRPRSLGLLHSFLTSSVPSSITSSSSSLSLPTVFSVHFAP